MLLSAHARRCLGEVKEEGRGGMEGGWAVGNATSSLRSESMKTKLEEE